MSGVLSEHKTGLTTASRIAEFISIEHAVRCNKDRDIWLNQWIRLRPDEISAMSDKRHCAMLLHNVCILHLVALPPVRSSDNEVYRC